MLGLSHTSGAGPSKVSFNYLVKYSLLGKLGYDNTFILCRQHRDVQPDLVHLGGGYNGQCIRFMLQAREIAH